MADNSPQLYASLTQRELEILSLLAEKLADREIAERLVVALTTVKWYNRQIFNKLGVVNRREAIERARTLGLLGEPVALPKHNLPTQTTLFVGRTHELADVSRLLADPNTRLVTILAPGGMGKTRFALATATSVLAHFADGAYFVPLAPLTSPDHLIPTIAEYTGFQFSPDSRTPKQQLLDFLSRKTLLLVLDNFEHLLDGAPLVSDILQAAPGVKLITTSRERLNLHGETVYALGGMAYPDKPDANDVLAYSAVQLFVQCSQRAQPQFALNGDSAAVAHICQLVQGMPLAIELAAAWAGTLSTTEIADEITHSLDFLHTTMRDVPERLRSVRAVFESTWQRMTEDERTVFCRLSVFRGGCTRQAAQAVTHADVGTLTGLVNKALLWRNPVSGRYEVHELLRQYAEERLSASGEDKVIREAHSGYYLSALHECRPDLEGRRQLEALKDIESDIENVRAAWLWAAQHRKYDLISQSLHSLWLYYLIHGQSVEGGVVFEQAANALRNAASGPARDTVLGAVLARQAFFSLDVDLIEKANSLIEESQALLRDSNAPEAQAFLAFAEGWPFRLGKPRSDVRPFLEKALALYQQIGDGWSTAFALLGLGASYLPIPSFIEGLDVPQARKFLQEALTIQQALGDIYLRARTLRGLGMAAGVLREYEAAARLTLAGLQYNKQLGNWSRVAGDLVNLSVTAAEQSKMWQSDAYLKESLALFREAGAVAGIGLALGNLALNAIFEGDFTRAKRYVEDEMGLAESAEHTQQRIYSLGHLGMVAWAQGSYDEAEAASKRQTSLEEADSNQYGLWQDLLWLATVMLAQGKRQEAHQHLERAMRLAAGLEHPLALEMCRIRMGKLAYEEGNYIQARVFLDASLPYFKSGAALQIVGESWENTEIAEGLVILGDVERADGQHDAAWRIFHEALGIAWSMRQRQPQLLMVLAGIADLLAAQSQCEQAAKLAAFVRDNPKAYAVDRTRASHLFDALRAVMSPDAFTHAVEHAKSLELETLIPALLSAN